MFTAPKNNKNTINKSKLNSQNILSNLQEDRKKKKEGKKRKNNRKKSKIADLSPNILKLY